MKRTIYVFGMLIMLSLGLAAQESEELQKIVIGGDYNYPPYEFVNAQGEPDGYNVELSRAICRDLGLEPEFKLAKWSLVRSWLEQGTIDIVQGMAFLSERAQDHYFSQAHTITWRGIFVADGSPITSLTSGQNVSVVVQKDDVAVDYLENIGFDGSISEVPTQEEALKLLNDGLFDACIANYMMSLYIIHRDGLRNIKSLPQRIDQKDYCYAARNQELIHRVNAALVNISNSGELNALQEKWFSGFNTDSYSIQSHPALAWRIVFAMAILLLVGCILLAIKLRKIKLQNKALERADLQLKELELELDSNHASFVQGPVVLYKMDYAANKLLMITDNVKNWGFSPQQMLEFEDRYSQIIYSEDLTRVQDFVENTQVDEAQFIQYRIVTRSGEIRWVLDYNRMIQDKYDGKRYVYGYVIDVTEHKHMESQLLEAKEKAEAASIAKSHFLANMSHEIRTPLNGINGFLQVLMQMQSTPDQREIYELMYSSSRNLMKIINDVLDFSKIEAGKMELIPSEFNPAYLVEDLVKQFSFQNPKQDLQIVGNVSPSLPSVLKGDQLRLKQILINLMQNALKFTDRGIIELGAEIYTISETDVRILFKVSDTGIGIDPVKQQDIFDNYTQAESTVSVRYGGTGLGLAIVKKLVEMMQGFIWLESEPGKGSCFFFILPFKIYTETLDKAPLEKMPDTKEHPKLKGRVLLVEDEPINQKVSQRQLELWGLQAEIANTGQEAVDKHQTILYDLILMDIQLPVMDGLSATQQIRDMEKVLIRHTPIVAYTAAALMGDRERFLHAGMD
ncbi:MAG: transporter substrate-binding domain-containing protein, partial [Candidatus Cloacimonetes bacterium]|nr:transporter substrate-binding domain-containing protein [Candidatus Cloacimonadota bacterium]